jgi:GNAT superfamily N-acetyltransferase
MSMSTRHAEWSDSRDGETPRRLRLSWLRMPAQLIEILDTDLLEWDADREIPEARGPAEIMRIEPDGTDEWREVIPPSRHGAIVWSRRRGDVAYVAVLDGNFAGWFWLSRSPYRRYPGSGLKVRLAPDEAYAYGLSVDEQYRPQGVAVSLIARELSDAQNDPAINRVYGWVDRRNRQSDVILRMVFGFKQAQRIRRLRLLRRWGFQVPFSARPPRGPLSRTGRHSR